MNLTDRWIWQSPSWTDFQWQDELILPRLRATRLKLGVLLGKASLRTCSEQSLDNLLADIIASSAIEDEQVKVLNRLLDGGKSE